MAGGDVEIAYVSVTNDPIRDFFAAYAAAVRAKDVQRFSALYADDVVVFDAWGSWCHVGRAAWQDVAREWFGSLGPESVVVEFDELRSHVSGDLAHGSAFVTYAAISPDGERLRSLDQRITVVAARRDEVWKIVHEHTSAPADFHTKAVSLRRAAR